MPGVIDDHVHFRDPGLTHKADMHTESTAAAAGGVPSIMDMPNTTPQTTNLEALEAKFADAATKSVVNYSFYFGATNNNADMLSQLDKTRICGVKLFMGASTGNKLVDRMEVLRKVFANAGMLIATHCEEQAIISANTIVFKEKYGEEHIYECPICIVESEIHMVQALEDIKKAGCNALVVYLGNFGPELSETLLAKHFDGPKMFVAAAEESGNNLIQGRGDAYCGMLNASYNL